MNGRVARRDVVRSPAIDLLGPLLLLTILLGFAACTETKEVAGPCLDCPFVVIQGTFRGIDGPIDAQVTASAVDEGPYGRDRVAAQTDSTGSYRLLVPPGRYVLEVAEGSGALPRQYFVWTEDGLKPSGDPDTLDLALSDGVRTMDFVLGGLRLNVGAPSEYDEQGVSARVHSVGAGFGNGDRARVESGHAVLDLPNLPPGEYHVQLAVGSTDFWYPGVQDRAQAALVSVAGLERTVLDVELPRPGRLRGQVTGSWQSMDLRDRPEVSLFPVHDSTDVLNRTRIAKDGSFDLQVLTQVSARVQVEMEYRRRWIGGTSFETATTFDLAPNRTVEGADFVESGFRVFFDVPTPEDADGASVDFTLTDAEKRLLFKSSGSFRPKSHLAVPNLSVGTYYLYVRPRRFGREPWVPQWFDGSQWLATATPITIPHEGDAIDIVMRPTIGGELPGRLRAANGLPDTRPILVVIDLSEPRRVVRAEVDADATGRFVLRGLRTGGWKIGVFGFFDQHYWYPGTFDVNEATTVSVVAGEQSPMIEWTYPQ